MAQTSGLGLSGRVSFAWTRRVSYWPMLLGPLAVGLVALARVTLSEAAFEQVDAVLEVVAPYLLIAPTALYAVRSIVTRNPLHVILTFLCVSLLCREIHFAYTGRIIFVCLGVTVVWMILWARRLARPLTDWRHTSWLLATMATYLLSQLVAKRVFKFVPGENAIHSKIEEAVETTAHLMLIATSLLANWRSYRRRAD